MDIVFTYHALDQMKRRKIILDEVTETIKYPDIIQKKHGKYFYNKKLNRGIIEVCCERTESNIKVITIYWM